MTQVFSHQNVKLEVRLLFQIRPCHICRGQSCPETGFSPSTSVFPCQYHAAIVPYLSSHTCFSYQKSKRAKLGALQTAVLFQELFSTG